MKHRNAETPKRRNRIEEVFDRLRADGRTALMPFVTAGHPSLDVTAATVLALEPAGASIVEIGIPFSDPIADGPVIAASMHEALVAGVTPAGVFDMVRVIRPKTSLGLLAMVSHSIVHRQGVCDFVADAAAAGFDGLIVPDVDETAAAQLAEVAETHGVSLSMLIAPTTAEERIARLTALCSGFVYVLARVGITGERADAPELTRTLETVRRHTDLPLAVGFGISTRAHVAAVTSEADAAIVGSALVRRMAESDDPVKAAADFVSDLAEGLDRRMRAS